MVFVLVLTGLNLWSVVSFLYIYWTKAALLTIVTVCQDGHFGTRELDAHLTAHGHAEAHVEALFLLVQRIIDDYDAAKFLPFIFVEAQHAVVVFGSGDVVRVGQDSAGDGACGCA